MSDEPVTSTPPVEGGQCSFEDLVCIDRPEDHYDDNSQLCSAATVVPTLESEYFSHAPFKTLQTDTKALANRSKHFKSKPKSSEVAKKPDEQSVAPQKISNKKEETTQDARVAEALAIQHSPKQTLSGNIEGVQRNMEAIQANPLFVPASIHCLAYPSVGHCFDSNMGVDSRNGSRTEYPSEEDQKISNASIPIVVGAALVASPSIPGSFVTGALPQLLDKTDAVSPVGSIISLLFPQLFVASLANRPEEVENKEGSLERPSGDDVRISHTFAAPTLLSVSDPTVVFADLVNVGSIGGVGIAILFQSDVSISLASNPVLILPPSIVSPRESNGSNIMTANNLLAQAHSRVEEGSGSETSRNSSQQDHSDNSHSGQQEYPNEEEAALGLA